MCVSNGQLRRKTMDEEKLEFRKTAVFDGGNFNNWKFRTEILFKEYGIHKFLTKTTNEFDETVQVDGETAERRTERLKKNWRKRRGGAIRFSFKQSGTSTWSMSKIKKIPRKYGPLCIKCLNEKGYCLRLRWEIMTICKIIS